MAHSYKSLYPPDITVDAGVVRFFEAFYKLSDDPSSHEQYAKMFTNDATFILASKVSHGYDEILRTRQAMWAAVSSRSHTPIKTFPFGNGAHEYMLHGVVKYQFKLGERAEVDWAARVDLTEEQGIWKMKYYQVYLDTAAAKQGK